MPSFNLLTRLFFNAFTCVALIAAGLTASHLTAVRQCGYVTVAFIPVSLVLLRSLSFSCMSPIQGVICVSLKMVQSVTHFLVCYNNCFTSSIVH